jgi:hypothetical protein
MKYYIATITNTFGNTQQHIIQPIKKDVFSSFPMTDDNPNMVDYLAWVADGNTADEWQPDIFEPEITQPDMEEEV